MREDESWDDFQLAEQRNRLVGSWFYDVRKKENVFVFSVDENVNTLVDKRKQRDYLCVLIAWAVGNVVLGLATIITP
jgi:hypothetical protein